MAASGARAEAGTRDGDQTSTLPPGRFRVFSAMAPSYTKLPRRAGRAPIRKTVTFAMSNIAPTPRPGVLAIEAYVPGESKVPGGVKPIIAGRKALFFAISSSGTRPARMISCR